VERGSGWVKQDFVVNFGVEFDEAEMRGWDIGLKSGLSVMQNSVGSNDGNAEFSRFKWWQCGIQQVQMMAMRNSAGSNDSNEEFRSFKWWQWRIQQVQMIAMRNSAGSNDGNAESSQTSSIDNITNTLKLHKLNSNTPTRNLISSKISTPLFNPNNSSSRTATRVTTPTHYLRKLTRKKKTRTSSEK
jgi:hypothetical protein